MHETRLEYYITDMLWANASGMQYKDAKRYRELEEKPKQIEDTKSGTDILLSLIEHGKTVNNKA